jgi:hypothetical protein
MTDKKELLEAELEHYRLLNKNKEERLSSLRKEFPDFTAKNIVDKYRTIVNEHFTTNSPAPNKRRSERASN